VVCQVSLCPLKTAVGTPADAPEGFAAPADKLRDAALAYLHFALENPSRVQVMFHAPFDRRNYDEYISAYEETLAVVESLTRACGWTDTETATSLIWSSVHGIVELGLSGRLYEGDPKELDRLAVASVARFASPS
jgi:hypothetical protein